MSTHLRGALTNWRLDHAEETTVRCLSGSIQFYGDGRASDLVDGSARSNNRREVGSANRLLNGDEDTRIEPTREDHASTGMKVSRNSSASPRMGYATLPRTFTFGSPERFVADAQAGGYYLIPTRAPRASA